MVAAHNSLWIGTENGIIVSFPFSSPTVVAEEAGWEVRTKWADGTKRTFSLYSIVGLYSPYVAAVLCMRIGEVHSSFLSNKGQ